MCAALCASLESVHQFCEWPHSIMRGDASDAPVWRDASIRLSDRLLEHVPRYLPCQEAAVRKGTSTRYAQGRVHEPVLLCLLRCGGGYLQYLWYWQTPVREELA